MGYAAKDRKVAERRFAQQKRAIGEFMRGERKTFPRAPWRTSQKPMRHVDKFHEPSFKGEPWFFRRKSQKED